MIKKAFLGIILSMILATLTQASPFSIVTSLINSGDLAGGLRYSINPNWAIDGWASQRENKTGQFWVDCYYKNYGLILSGEENKALNYAAAYSVEHSITDKIALGVMVKAIEVSDTKPSYLGGWDAYLVLRI